MNEAEKKIHRQLDLTKFIRRFRIHTIASMSILDWRSKHVIHKLSQFTLKDADHNYDSDLGGG